MIDFAIVGTFKSATSTIAYELRKKQNFDIPRIKDPYYYISDRIDQFTGPQLFAEQQKKFSVKDRLQMEEMFEPRQADVLRGDATPLYLYCHNDSIPNIRMDNPKTKIVILLRNPIYRAFSNYQHNKKDGFEQRTFEECIATWEKHETFPLHPFFHYIRAGLYAEQVRAFIENFDKVGIFTYGDFKDNPAETLKQISSFLGHEHSFDDGDIVRLNKTGSSKSKTIHEFLTYENIIKKALRPIVRPLIKDRNQRIELVERIKNFNIRSENLSSGNRERLQKIYREDVAYLSDLIERDLATEWGIH